MASKRIMENLRPFPVKKPAVQPASLVEAGNGLLSVLTSAQRILADYVHPQGISKNEALNFLLDLLDGPRTRKARDVWEASLQGARLKIVAEPERQEQKAKSPPPVRHSEWT